jgi:hypothetical protein
MHPAALTLGSFVGRSALDAGFDPLPFFELLTEGHREELG